LLKVIIFIFHNLRRVPVRRTGALHYKNHWTIRGVVGWERGGRRAPVSFTEVRVLPLCCNTSISSNFNYDDIGLGPIHFFSDRL